MILDTKDIFSIPTIPYTLGGAGAARRRARFVKNKPSKNWPNKLAQNKGLGQGERNRAVGWDGDKEKGKNRFPRDHESLRLDLKC